MTDATLRTPTAPPGSSIVLPSDGGRTRRYRVGPAGPMPLIPAAPPTSRSVYAAAHVVVDPLRSPSAPEEAGGVIDWDATAAFRHHLWSLGLGVADAMDTAQRGGGLHWRQAKELIARSGAEARSVGGSLACGAATDHLERADPSLSDIADAYLEQVGWIEDAGATPVLMASRQLAATARGPQDYLEVYDRVLSQVSRPVMLHWLGEAFDPVMRDYWGSADLDVATDTVLQVMDLHPGRVRGIKISLLDADREIGLRRRLPRGVEMFTGDDFNYDVLIRGDHRGHSHALLGVFDAIAGPARAALERLDDDDPDGFSAILAPTVPLARHLFAAPTSAYKTGVVFLAWLNGHQSHFHLLAGAQSRRSVPHLSRLFELADQAGALTDPDLAVHRMRQFLAVAGLAA